MSHKDVKSNHEIIDEEDVIENLTDGNDKKGGSQVQDEENSFQQRQIIYTKQIGCLDFRSMVINLGIYTLVLMVTSGLFEGVYISSFFNAVNTALVMLVLNILLKPILIVITLPLTIMTFGLFYVVVNGFLLWMTDYLMGPSFEINSFGLAILASVFISLLRMAINHYILKEDSLKINM